MKLFENMNEAERRETILRELPPFLPWIAREGLETLSTPVLQLMWDKTIQQVADRMAEEIVAKELAKRGSASHQLGERT